LRCVGDATRHYHCLSHWSLGDNVDADVVLEELQAVRADRTALT